jgi:hypothetical protein
LEAEVKMSKMMERWPGKSLSSEIFGTRKIVYRLTGPQFFGPTNFTGPKLGAQGGTPDNL